MPLRVRLTATTDLASLNWLNLCQGIGTNNLNALSKTISTTNQRLTVELVFPSAAAGDRFLALFSQMTDAPMEREMFKVEPL